MQKYVTSGQHTPQSEADVPTGNPSETEMAYSQQQQQQQQPPQEKQPQEQEQATADDSKDCIGQFY